MGYPLRMPFKSTAERGFLFANKPDIARRFAAETPKGAKLPEHVKKPKKKSPADLLYG